jgi:hypothetical protein
LQNWISHENFNDPDVGLGDHVTEAKLLMFLYLVEKRGSLNDVVNVDIEGNEVPARVKNSSGKWVRNPAIIDFYDHPKLVANSAKDTTRLNHNTIAQWVKAIVDLYSTQVDPHGEYRLNLNPHPHPRGRALKDYLNGVSSSILLSLTNLSC